MNATDNIKNDEHLTNLFMNYISEKQMFNSAKQPP